MIRIRCSFCYIASSCTSQLTMIKINSKDRDNLHLLQPWKVSQPNPPKKNFPQSRYSMIHKKGYKEGSYLRRSRRQSLGSAITPLSAGVCSELSGVVSTLVTSVMVVLPSCTAGAPLPNAPDNMASCCSLHEVLVRFPTSRILCELSYLLFVA